MDNEIGAKSFLNVNFYYGDCHAFALWLIRLVKDLFRNE
jgi:hypothetical protein